MSKWDYIRSVVILVASFFFVKTVFDLHPVEAISLVILVIVAVVHTMDVRDDILKKVDAKRDRRDNAHNRRQGDAQA